MPETLELPNGEVVTPENVFLYDEYPYRFVPRDDEYEFALTPLHWGGGEMDVPFPDRDALGGQWGPNSRGTLSAEEWRAWLADARDDDRFGDDEVDALAAELPTGDGVRSSEGGLLASEDGLLRSLRRRLGL
jgi:hypothetical protein